MCVLFIRTFNDRTSVREYMLKLEESLTKDTDKIRADLARVEATIADLRSERKRLVDAVRKGTLVDDDVKDDLNEIRWETERLEQSVFDLRKEMAIKSEHVHSVVDAFANDVVGTFVRADANKKRDMYTRYCTSIQTDGYDLVATFVTGTVERINTKQIPEDLMEEMVLLFFIDQHPEYVDVLEMLSHKAHTNRANDEEYDLISVNELVDVLPSQDFYDQLNAERPALRDKFILKTKGRPRKKKRGQPVPK